MPSLPNSDLEEITRGGFADLKSLAGGHLLLTGASGFFGRWLVSSFLHANRTLGLRARCTAIARRAVRLREEDPLLAADAALELVDADVRTWVPPGGASFTHVIHAAASAGTPAPSIGRDEMLATVVDGTRNVLSLCRSFRPARVLFTSSGAVYGRQPVDLDRITEDYCGGPDPAHPDSTYAEAKRLAENCCAIAAADHGVPVAIARGFAFAGPLVPLDAHFAFGNFIADALSRRTIVVRGDGTPFRSYLYASDLVRWLWALLARAPVGRAYNVGSDLATSIAELAHSIARTAGVDVEIRGIPTPGRTPDRYVPSIDRARRELGLDVSVDLATAVDRTLSWYISQPRKSSGPRSGAGDVSSKEVPEWRP